MQRRHAEAEKNLVLKTKKIRSKGFLFYYVTNSMMLDGKDLLLEVTGVALI